MRLDRVFFHIRASNEEIHQFLGNDSYHPGVSSRSCEVLRLSIHHWLLIVRALNFFFIIGHFDGYSASLRLLCIQRTTSRLVLWVNKHMLNQFVFFNYFCLICGLLIHWFVDWWFASGGTERSFPPIALIQVFLPSIIRVIMGSNFFASQSPYAVTIIICGMYLNWTYFFLLPRFVLVGVSIS